MFWCVEHAMTLMSLRCCCEPQPNTPNVSYAADAKQLLAASANWIKLLDPNTGELIMARLSIVTDAHATLGRAAPRSRTHCVLRTSLTVAPSINRTLPSKGSERQFPTNF